MKRRRAKLLRKYRWYYDDVLPRWLNNMLLRSERLRLARLERRR